MFETGKAMLVRYEDFCKYPSTTLFDMKEFVNSPIQDGNVGGFLSNNPKRIGEYKIHGNEVTDSRVCRWKQEKNQKLVKQANRFYELMKDYRIFWGY